MMSKLSSIEVVLKREAGLAAASWEVLWNPGPRLCPVHRIGLLIWWECNHESCLPQDRRQSVACLRLGLLVRPGRRGQDLSTSPYDIAQSRAAIEVDQTFACSFACGFGTRSVRWVRS